MKTRLGTLLFCLALAFAGYTAAKAQDSADTELFNGKDFAGWTFCMRSNSAPEKTWSVTNGVIHCAGRPVGYLRTKKSYHDYKLTVEWRFVKVAPHADNTGVLIQMQLPDKIWPKCIECQGQYKRQGDFWLQGGTTAEGYQNTGKKNIHVPMTGPENEKPAGEWNTYQIIARGDTVETIVNGRSLNKITGCNVSSGFIGIQSEGADIEVRKMHLEPLPTIPEDTK
ncbi:MAG TPA: DUF1080 domain-containing protein [Candidatus Binatia bacterium]|nr:DUF1080 domain-containing protein [Candidatus Binatia bacterium]